MSVQPAAGRSRLVLEHEPGSGRTSFEVKKHFGEPVVIKEIHHRPPMGEKRVIRLDSPLEMAAGAVWEGKL